MMIVLGMQCVFVSGASSQNPRVLNWLRPVTKFLQPRSIPGVADSTLNRLIALGDADSLQKARQLLTTRIGEQAPNPDSVSRIMRLSRRTEVDSIRAARQMLFRMSVERSCARSFRPSRPASWFGVRNDVASCVWGAQGLESLDLTSVYAGSKSAAVYSDLVAVYFGPFRTSVATMISASAEDSTTIEEGEQEDTEDARAALQRLVSGGGNLLATVQLPLFRLNVPAANNFQLAVIGSGRYGTDVKELGAGTVNTAENLAAAVNVHANIYSDNKEVLIYGYWRTETVRGSDELVRFITEARGTIPSDTTSLAGKSFGYSRASVGALLWNTLQITWTRPYFCSECETLGIGGQASISFQKKTQ